PRIRSPLHRLPASYPAELGHPAVRNPFGDINVALRIPASVMWSDKPAGGALILRHIRIALGPLPFLRVRSNAQVSDQLIVLIKNGHPAEQVRNQQIRPANAEVTRMPQVVTDKAKMLAAKREVLEADVGPVGH